MCWSHGHPVRLAGSVSALPWQVLVLKPQDVVVVVGYHFQQIGMNCEYSRPDKIVLPHSHPKAAPLTYSVLLYSSPPLHFLSINNLVYHPSTIEHRTVPIHQNGQSR